MNRYFYFIIAFFIFLHGYSQKTTRVKIIDSETKQSIAFANIIFNGSSNYGTISDIDGFFQINSNVTKLTISYLGYETLTVPTNNIVKQLILLTPKASELNEVVINSDYNPAIPIMKKVIENKDRNNPENLNSFTYTSYNKIIFDIIAPESADSINDLFKDKHVFITETVSERKYLKPNLTEEVIIATKASGIKNPTFASLATDFQPFSFYKDLIELYEMSYLNPISNGSLKNYDFKLEDEFMQDTDTVFVISFQPKKGKNFEGLKGVLNINSNQYAIQTVDASPFTKMKMDIKIQQKYVFANDSHWFPEQLNFESEVGAEDFKIQYSGKSYFDHIVIGDSLKRNDFSYDAVYFKKGANSKHDVFWDKHRSDSLDKKEQMTYKFMDSLGKALNFDTKLKMFESLITGRYAFKYVDLDITKIIGYNKYEGLRLGAGLYTNDDLVKNISFGGFLGYGFRDKTLKYGTELSAKIPGKNEIAFTLKYENQLREVGTTTLSKTFSLIDLRRLIAERMDRIESFSFQTDSKPFRNFYASLALSTTEITPKYAYKFIENQIAITNYHNSEVHLNLKYISKEKVLNSYGNKLQWVTDAPVLNFTYSKGMKGFIKGDFDYNKYEISLDHSFQIPRLGKTSYQLKGGYVDSAIPYGLLFTGEGGSDADYPVYIKNTFQTSSPYEFLSNVYINVFTAHNFGGLLLKRGKFQPEIVFHNNLGYGNLSEPDKHVGIAITTKNKLYLETGLELGNLYKINYFNVGSLGLGLGAFYRYGQYRFEDFGDNIHLKFKLGFTFK